MDFQGFIEGEEKASETLNAKKEACQNEIQRLREALEQIKDDPLIPLETAPVFNKARHDQALSDEKKRKERMQLRGETYTPSDRNRDILGLPQKIKEIEGRNNEIEDKNDSIKESNLRNENERKKLNATLKE